MEQCVTPRTQHGPTSEKLFAQNRLLFLLVEKDSAPERACAFACDENLPSRILAPIANEDQFVALEDGLIANKEALIARRAPRRDSPY
jgi:hypothetical protein